MFTGVVAKLVCMLIAWRKNEAEDNKEEDKKILNEEQETTKLSGARKQVQFTKHPVNTRQYGLVREHCLLAPRSEYKLLTIIPWTPKHPQQHSNISLSYCCSRRRSHFGVPIVFYGTGQLCPVFGNRRLQKSPVLTAFGHKAASLFSVFVLGILLLYFVSIAFSTAVEIFVADNPANS